MSNYNPKIHHRKSIRLKGYDYSREGLYFITLNCKNRFCLFGEVINGEMKLNELGKIAHEEWLNTEKVRKNCRIHSFIIMPDHIHGIVEITFKVGNNEENIGEFKSPIQTIGSIIRGFKIAVIKKIRSLEIQSSVGAIVTEKLNYKIWQRDYYEHIIRNNAEYKRIVSYILENPNKWSEK